MGLKIFAFFIWVALIFWQLWSGKVLGRSGRVSATRQEHPGTYWFTIAVQTILFLILLFVFSRQL